MPISAGVSDELFAVASLLDHEFVLRRALSDPSTSTDGRSGCATPSSAGSCRADIGHRPGCGGRPLVRPPDLTDALEDLGRQVVFISAEQNGELDEVEDELFRFGRILDREPRWRPQLADRSAPPARRAELLDSLLTGKVAEPTRRLLEHVVAEPRERALDRVIARCSTQAAARRSRSVARVRSSVALSPDQQSRLARRCAASTVETSRCRPRSTRTCWVG